MTRPWHDGRLWILAGAFALVTATLFVPEVELEREAYDVVAVVDITGSMNTRDAGTQSAPSSRLAASRRTLQDLVARLPCRSRMGLGVFTERRTFLLLNPVEVCSNFDAIDGAIESLDWRMSWEGDSYVAKGIYSAIDIAGSLEADLIFLTDGHEAPPLPHSGLPDFEGKPGEVKGLIVGVGGTEKSPIPKFDDDGREVGAWGALDVPHDNRIGAPPAGTETREGYHPKWAPFGAAAPVGEEHLSSVRPAHLMAVAAKTGLTYAGLAGSPDLLGALRSAAHPRLVVIESDVRPYPAGLALALLIILYGLAPALAWLRTSMPGRRARAAIAPANGRTS